MRKEKLEELKKLLDEVRPISKSQVILEKEDLEDSFIKVSTYNILLNNGQSIRREKITKNNQDGSSVFIFALLDNNEVILSVEPRVFTNAGVMASLPAGYINEGESPTDASIRELLEETGYLAKTSQVVTSFYQDEGISSAYNYGVLLTDLIDTGNQHLDKDEFVKKFTCSIDEVLEFIDMGYIESVSAKYTIYKALEKIKIKKR